MTNPKAVPPFKSYTPATAELEPKQQAFYQEWLAAWTRGEALDVQGQVSYVFRYVYLTHFPWGYTVSMQEAPLQKLKTAREPIKTVRDAYWHEPILRDYLSNDIATIWVKLGEYGKAVEVHDSVPITASVIRTRASHIMNLKIALARPISSREVLLMCADSLTKFGKDNVDSVAEHIAIHIATIERQSGSILEKLSRTARVCTPSPHMPPEFGALERYDFASPVESLRTPDNPNANPVMDVFGDIIRSAENALREDRGLPKVGEGWIAETELYYNIKNAMPDHHVEQHGRPKWLGQQHLDVWLPDIAVAIEYHGLQHDQPVEFFGGAKALKKTQERDARKRRRCKQNNVTLIEVRPGYVLEELLQQISEATTSLTSLRSQSP